MDLQLPNKKAQVTGSTAGIGFAIASLLTQEGATVVVNGRSQGRVEEAVRGAALIGPGRDWVARREQWRWCSASVAAATAQTG